MFTFIQIHIQIHTHTSGHKPEQRPAGFSPAISISSFLRMVLWSEACAHLSEQALLCPTLVQAHCPPMPSPCCHPYQAGPAKLPCTKQLFLRRPMTRGVASPGKCFKKYFHVLFSPFWGLKKKFILEGGLENLVLFKPT